MSHLAAAATVWVHWLVCPAAAQFLLSHSTLSSNDYYPSITYQNRPDIVLFAAKSERYQMNTADILFILSGALDSLVKVVQERLSKDVSRADSNSQFHFQPPIFILAVVFDKSPRVSQKNVEINGTSRIFVSSRKRSVYQMLNFNHELGFDLFDFLGCMVR